MISARNERTRAAAATPQRRARYRFPLFLRLSLLALVVGLVPLGAVAWATLDINADALRYASRQLHLALVADAVRSVRADLSHVHEELVGVGQLLVAPGLGDDDKRLALAGARVTASKLVDWVTLYSVDGERLGTLKADETEDPATPEALPEELRLAANTGGFSSGAVRRGATGPELELATAIVVDGETKGFLFTSMHLAQICASLAESGERRLGDRNGVYAVDSSRRLVLAADTARVLSGESLQGKGIFESAEGAGSFRAAFGLTPEFQQDGKAMLGALETIPELGWAVIVAQPLAVAYAPLVKLREAMSVAIGVAALFALLAGLLGARSITRPVGRLLEATRALARRDFKAIPRDVAERRDEIGALSKAFSQMAGELEQSEKRLVQETRVRDSLARYLPGSVVELIVSDPSRLRLSGEKREVSVLFADVCGFTKLSETLPPERIVALLNELFTVATEIIQKRGGVIDKFIGDSVMAVWGTPDTHPDDAWRAVEAANDLRRWVEALNRRFRKTHGVEVQVAFGIATGPVVAGNIGSEKRLEYTVIGDTVNVAARLESMAQPGQILVNLRTQEAIAGRLRLTDVGQKKLHGRETLETVYEVVA